MATMRAIVWLVLATFVSAQEQLPQEKLPQEQLPQEQLPQEQLLQSRIAILHPDVGLTTIQLVQKYGYPIEQHKNIETEDGYLLEMHRIPNGKKYSDKKNKPAVLLMHGLLSSSADWVNMGPEKSLALLLADLGYDVWMGNARGNTWSRKHIEYNANSDNDFWAFSWHEIGKYDLPRKIDYIIEKTGQQKISYIGHSQGTTSFFVMGSERPEYNDKIKIMISLAPVAYMSRMKSPFFQLLSNFYNSIRWITKFIGLYEFMPSTELLKLIGQVTCKDNVPFQEICANVMFLICGYDSAQLNRTMIPVITSNLPAGSSTSQLIHYAQGIKTGLFRQYDFGLIVNVMKYGQLTPPEYALNKVTAPVALFYAQNDWLSAIPDVQQLYGALSNSVYKKQIDNSRFNHLDYLYAIDVVDLVYKDVFKVLEKYDV